MYTFKLSYLGLWRSAEGDRLLWEGKDATEGLKAREVYASLIKNKPGQMSGDWFKKLWKTIAQLKKILFLWLVRKDKNLTWKNLQKKGWHGPGRCCLCGEEEEDNIHLFYLCPFALETLEIVCGKLHIDTLVYYLTEDCLKWWINRGELVRVIPILFHWHIWCTRNKKLFEDIPCQPLLTAHKIVNTWDLLKIAYKPPPDLSRRMHPYETHFPIGYFDGASQHSIYGCGVWLKISPECHYKIFWNGGNGSNMKAEVLAI